ncbi:hypothetical protein [Bradyrhizobium zhanjiangense]|uniref:hypothetical protein n=1 Tax=Bradyrhizobium zhanjiangense TaxID=1325107 RepID=UPI001008D493|nr:hypothetical protein [Bradyrhizobium zhanjiangense]
MLGISTVAFGNLLNAQVIERQPRSAGYDLRTVVRAACEHWRRQAAGRGAPGEERVLSSARARQAVAAAEQLELRTAIARGEYVSLAAIGKALDGLIITMRQQFLWAIPPAVVAVVKDHAPGADSGAIFEAVDDVVRDALTQFADGAGQIADTKPEAGEADVGLKHARRLRGAGPDHVGDGE